MGAVEVGLEMNTDNHQVLALNISNFELFGILIFSNSNAVAGCFIGTNPTARNPPGTDSSA